MDKPCTHDPKAPVCQTCGGYGGFYDCQDCLDGKAHSRPPVTDKPK